MKRHTIERAYLRQLCCSGLGQDLVIPEFLKAVQRLIPSVNNVYTAVNDQGFPTAVITEFFDPKTIALMGELLSVKIIESMSRCDRQMASGNVINEPRMFFPDFYQSDFYNLIWRPHGQHYNLYGLIKIRERIIAKLQLFRPPLAKPFSQQEEDFFAQLLPYVAHAVQKPANLDIPYDGCDEQAILIADSQGNMLHQSTFAGRLLWLASSQSPYLMGHTADFDQAQVIRWICGNLEAIFQNQDAPPPSFTYTNGCGRFIFRAHWLHPNTPEPGGLIGITIEHQEPQLLKILRGLQQTNLSINEREIAALLAQGCSKELICQRLHIKSNTYKDHLRKIYLKLDIHQRDELLPKLLAMADSLVLVNGAMPLMPMGKPYRIH
jgi:DNA-binding CsgD family transcriptional regulator